MHIKRFDRILKKKDDEKIKEKLDTIIEKNPEQTFYLYLDLKILE